MTSLKQCALTVGIAGAMAIGAMSSSFAAPLTSAALIKATPTQAIDVAWRGGGGRGGFARGGGVGRGGFARSGFRGGFAHRGFGRGGRIGAGVALGIIGGAAAANAYAPGYYGDGPYYADPYADSPDVAYDPAYADPPVAYAPGPNARSCWVYTDPDRRYGYNRC